MPTTLTIADDNQKIFFGYTLPSIKKVWFDSERIYFEYENRKVIGAPLEWYPRLHNATTAQRNNYEIGPGGYGVRWEEIDEDLSAEGMFYFGK
jgi:hypothetical protein